MLVMDTEMASLAAVFRAARAADSALGPATGSAPAPRTVNDVRRALLILFQHGCLTVEAHPDHADPPPEEGGPVSGSGARVLLYSIETSAVLHRLRFARLLSIVRSSLGDDAEAMLAEVLYLGRICTQKLLDVVAGKELEDGESMGMDRAKHALSQLTAERFLASVGTLEVKKRSVEPLYQNTKKSPGASLWSSLASNTAAAGAKTRVGNKVSASVAAAPVAKVRKRGRAAANATDDDHALPLELRLMGGTTTAPSADSSFAQPAEIERAQVVSDAPALKKKKTEDHSSGSGFICIKHRNYHPNFLFVGLKMDSVWSVNWTHYIAVERHQLCSRIVAKRMGSHAGAIVASILANSIHTERHSQQLKSSPMSVAAIHAALKQTSSNSSSSRRDDLRPIDIVTLKRLLEVLRLDSMAILIKVISVS